MDNRDKGLAYSEQQARMDSINAKQIQRIVDQESREFINWWSDFQSEYPEFEQSDYSELPNRELVNQLDNYAISNGERPVAVSNVDQLVEYAVVLFSIVIARRSEDLIKKALGKEVAKAVDFGTKVYHTTAETISDKVIKKNFEGRKWSDTIWKNQNELRSDLSKIMRESLIESRNPLSYTRELRDKFGVAKWKIERILRTESARVSARQQIKNLKAADIEWCEWLSAGGACNTCAQLDGRYFRVSEYGAGQFQLPKHPNCRCTIVGVYDDDLGLED